MCIFTIKTTIHIIRTIITKIKNTHFDQQIKAVTTHHICTKAK